MVPVGVPELAVVFADNVTVFPATTGSGVAVRVVVVFCGAVTTVGIAGELLPEKPDAPE